MLSLQTRGLICPKYGWLRRTLAGDTIPVMLQRPNTDSGEEAEASRQLDECALAHCKRVAAHTSPFCHLQATLRSGASLFGSCTGSNLTYEDLLVISEFQQIFGDVECSLATEQSNANDFEVLLAG